MFYAFFIVTLVTIQISAKICEQSLTTVSGTHAPTGPICKNQLIFRDEFTSLRQDVWEHENNFLGGGVSLFSLKSLNNNYKTISKFFRMVNSSGIQIAVKTHMWTMRYFIFGQH